MKTKLLITLILGAVLSAWPQDIEIYLPAQNTTTKSVSVPTPYRHIDILENGYEVSYRIDSLAIVPHYVIENAYTIKLNGFYENDTEGEAEVLFRTDRLAIPGDADCKIEIIQDDYIDYLLPIGPVAKKTTADGENLHPDTDIFSTIIEYDGFLPERVIKTDTPEFYHGNTFQCFKSWPIQYNSKTGMLRIHHNLIYRITWESELERLPVDMPLDATMQYLCSDMPELSEPMLLSADNTSYVVNAPVEYLIIAPEKYESQIRILADWKRHLGYNVTLALQTSFTTENITQIVQEFYKRAKYTTCYALLVGNREDMPASLEFPLVYDYDHMNDPLLNTTETDLYYFCFQDENPIALSNSSVIVANYPNIHYGRLPVWNEEELSSVVAKTIAYESADSDPKNTCFSGLAVFQTDSVGGKFPGIEKKFQSRTTEGIVQDAEKIFHNVNRIYKCDQENVTPTSWSYISGEDVPFPKELLSPDMWNGGPADISAALSNGTNIMLYLGHGARREWNLPNFTVQDIRQLKNKTLPVVFCLTCWNGKWREKDTFAREFLINPEGGAVALVASTAAGLITTTNKLAQGIFWNLWSKVLPQSNCGNKFKYKNPRGTTSTLAELLNNGLLLTKELNASDYDYMQHRRMYHCIGDPSLNIFWNNSVDLGKVVNISGDSNHISVSINDEDYCYIAYYNPATGTSSRVYGNTAYFSYPHSDYASIYISRPGCRPLL